MDELKEKYKKHMSIRDYTYFDQYSDKDKIKVIYETQEKLRNLSTNFIKEKCVGLNPEFLAVLCHVSYFI